MDKQPTDEETIEAFKQMLGTDAEDAITEPPETEPEPEPGEQASEENEFLRKLFGTGDPSPAEPPIEGLAPKSKPIAEYTEAEWAAQAESLERTVRRRAEHDEQERRDAEEREQAAAARTDDQRLGDAIRESAMPGVKAARNEAFIRSIHGGEEA